MNMADPPRTVLISGCSSGIGLQLAVQLARDPRQRYQVNNAGVGLVGPLEGLSLTSMQKVFDTNFFGAVRLVKAVLPGMKRRRQGHIVVVSSVMGLQGVVFNDVYAASKFALEGFFESLAVQLLQFDIFVSLVEPGPVATDFEGKLLEQVSAAEPPGADPDTLHYFRDLYLPASRELFRSLGQSPEDVAQGSTPQVIVKVISSASPPLRRQTNARYSPLTALKAADPSGSLYVRTAHRLLFRWPRLLGLGLRCLACGCLRSRVWPR
ncbi:retinol dehydrogenase 8 isoform X5 [Phyllostomus discolor]|uniref:Retinol dehydrogenase 8 isoform X5 n=1 Tax=Phyllostomus discolor TaxID=89673 RepID=A0A7E6EAU3_9CHIR|nr:retinol dehydrogenase 8 isoform X5 [Phyllostomus discolor]